MKNIYFLDEYNSSLQNGIGTFRDIFAKEMGSYEAVKFAIISLSAPTVNIETQMESFGIQYLVPQIYSLNWRDSGAIICPLLRSLINDSEDNIFIINHSPCSKFIDVLRRTFPFSKIVFIIHDQGWCYPLRGSVSLFKELIERQSLPMLSTQQASDILAYYCEEKKIYLSVDAVVCLTQSTYELLKAVYNVPTDKTHLIPNGYSSQNKNAVLKFFARTTLGIREDTQLLIYSGRPSPAKGLEPLLIAVGKLVLKYPRIKVVLCGAIAGFAQYTHLTQQFSSRIIYTGHLNKEALCQWYCSADLGLLPSYSEQFGYSAIEMIDMKLPVLISNGNGLTNLLPKSSEILVADVGRDVFDVEYYANNIYAQIDSYFTETPRYISDQSAVNAYINEHYSPRLMGKRYLNMFNTL